MTAPRKHLSRVARIRIFDKHRGKCCICGVKIHAERGEAWDIHHVVPICFGGADTEHNMAPAHTSPCHRETSADDNGHRAKADRMRANHLGIPKAGNRQRLPGGRDSDLRKMMSGKVVARFSQVQEHLRVMRERLIEK